MRPMKLLSLCAVATLLGALSTGACAPVSYTHLDVYKRQVWTYSTSSMGMRQILLRALQGICSKALSAPGKRLANGRVPVRNQSSVLLSRCGSMGLSR